MYTNVIVEDGCAVPWNLSRSDWLSTAGLTFRNVHANVGADTPAGCFVCTPERPCTDMVFEDVVVTGAGGGPAAAYVCKNALIASSSGSSPQPCGPSGAPSGAPSLPSPPVPTLPNVTLGPVETMVDWATSHCTCAQSPGCTDARDPDYSDTPPRAYTSADGVAHLWSTDAQSRQSTRAAASPAAPWHHNCSVHAPSHFDCRTSAFNFQTWLHSPYMLQDGVNAFALVHMEYHGWSCAGNSSCTHSNGGDCANEAIQLFVSSNGGWDWSPSDGGAGPPSNLVVVSPYTYEYARDNFNGSELGFGDPTSIVLDEGSGAYYAIISASNPEIGNNGYHGLQQRGQCLMRSATPMRAASWRAWDGQDFVAQFVDPYSAPVANVSAHTCKPINSTMIHVNLGWSVHFNAWISSGFGSYTYGNGTKIECCGAFLYSVSSDLLNWDTPQLIRPNQQEGASATWEYDPALLDETAWTARGKRNWHESIGASSAHLYFWQQDAYNASGYGRSIKRQSISFV